MRLTTALVITTICSLIGTLWGKPYLWLPYSGLAASFVDLPTRRWVASDRLGTAQGVSALLKAFFATIGFYAMVAQYASVLLLLYWIAR